MWGNGSRCVSRTSGDAYEQSMTKCVIISALCSVRHWPRFSSAMHAWRCHWFVTSQCNARHFTSGSQDSKEALPLLGRVGHWMDLILLKAKRLILCIFASCENKNLIKVSIWDKISARLLSISGLILLANQAYRCVYLGAPGATWSPPLLFSFFFWRSEFSYSPKGKRTAVAYNQRLINVMASAELPQTSPRTSKV